MSRTRQLIALGTLFAMLLLPWLNFDAEPGRISEVDNRQLTDTPPLSLWHANDWVEYINDRIGFREAAINTYQDLEYAIFGTVGVPGLHAGTGGEIYTDGAHWYNEGIVTGLADHVAAMQTYCEQRDIPFLYVIAPEKSEVYADNQAPGYPTGPRPVTKRLIELLEEREVEFLDLTPVLVEAKNETGERVFNRRYDPRHWNELGAFYGVNAIIERMRQWFPQLETNELDDFDISTDFAEYAVNSKFRIDDEYPRLELKEELGSPDVRILDDARISYQHRTRDETSSKSDGPRLLSLSGSYFNPKQQFLGNQFKEMYTVHNYENVADLDYYVNIVRPEAVVFTTATYTINSDFFDTETLETRVFSPPLAEPESVSSELRSAEARLTSNGLMRLCVLAEDTDDPRYIWLQSGDQTYDLRAREWGYNLYDFNGGDEFSEEELETECLMADIPLDEVYDWDTDSFADMRLFVEDMSGTLSDWIVEIIQ
ncbi:MAG: hypothetical protein Q4P71_06305 [Actinomycetaceae bacterium]|nr:hypothetical protein [Actinomycetaceae bacterium]